jgi:hypothetical protein
MRLVVISLALLAALAGCGSTPPPTSAADFPDDVPACIGDDDCVISRFAGCCACPGVPRVRARAELALQQESCAAVQCRQGSGCGSPPRGGPTYAVCERGHCIGRR